jgi:hypothetical protein
MQVLLLSKIYITEAKSKHACAGVVLKDRVEFSAFAPQFAAQRRWAGRQASRNAVLLLHYLHRRAAGRQTNYLSSAHVEYATRLVIYLSMRFDSDL